LHEDKLATKMTVWDDFKMFRSLLLNIHQLQIEKANLAELDWALANMGSSKTRKSKSTGEDWVAEAEAKGPKDKEDVSSQPRGTCSPN
jgi:hypothetical protein